MTLLFSFQEENCVIAASDLKLGHEPNNPAQTYLQPELNRLRYLPCEKFLKTTDGNLIAFGGTLNAGDIARVQQARYDSEDFGKNALWSGPNQ